MGFASANMCDNTKHVGRQLPVYGNQYCSSTKVSNTLCTTLGASLHIYIFNWPVLRCMQSLVTHHCKAAIAGYSTGKHGVAGAA